MDQPSLFAPEPLTVSEFTGKIKRLVEDRFAEVQIEGEVSNASTSRNGHTYFTLKDDGAQLSCVVWSGVNRRLNISLEDGQQVKARGDVQIYPPHGKYQLIVRSLEQAGVGALQKKFEKLKAQLKKEGLFDDAHKQPLPRFPRRIGVITSSTGAAFHDITDTLKSRWPIASVHLHHASVQGVNAAPELVKAINWFTQNGTIDVLIIGRGGGSLEDLWPFNEEAVARALFNCPIPTISAVGHEVDFSISDFVADARAATPTQAAIIATPDINEIRMGVDERTRRLETILTTRVDERKNRVQQLIGSHALLKMQDRLQSSRAALTNLRQQLSHRRELQQLRYREQLTRLQNKLALLNPNSALEKGYVRVKQDNAWIKKAAHFSADDPFELKWADGKVTIAEQ